MNNRPNNKRNIEEVDRLLSGCDGKVWATEEKVRPVKRQRLCEQAVNAAYDLTDFMFGEVDAVRKELEEAKAEAKKFKEEAKKFKEEAKKWKEELDIVNGDDQERLKMIKKETAKAKKWKDKYTRRNDEANEYQNTIRSLRIAARTTNTIYVGDTCGDNGGITADGFRCQRSRWLDSTGCCRDHTAQTTRAWGGPFFSKPATKPETSIFGKSSSSTIFGKPATRAWGQPPTDEYKYDDFCVPDDEVEYMSDEEN